MLSYIIGLGRAQSDRVHFCYAHNPYCFFYDLGVYHVLVDIGTQMK